VLADDLVARARKLAEYERAHAVGYISKGRALDECADRIEALERDFKSASGVAFLVTCLLFLLGLITLAHSAAGG